MVYRKKRKEYSINGIKEGLNTTFYKVIEKIKTALFTHFIVRYENELK